MRKHCELCSSEKLETVFDGARFQKASILQCKECELVCLEVKKSDSEIIEHYRHDYRTKSDFPSQSPEYNFNHPSSIKDANERTEWIKNSVPPGSKILEIGSASGRMLYTLKQAGFEVAGVELTEAYVEFSKKMGFNIFNKPLEELSVKSEFDLIVTFHCFEHILNPKETLSAVFRALTPGGIFLGEVPNQDDWRIKIFDNYTVKRFHYDPDHYFYYNAKTLANFFKETGFVDSDFSTVERYNSLLQLKRIMRGDYSQENWEKVLQGDIYVEPGKDVPVIQDGPREALFNRIFENGVNSKLMGNCLRWVARKPLP